MKNAPPRQNHCADPVVSFSNEHSSGRLLAIALVIGVLPSACKSPDEWSALADDEVYRLVAERRTELGLPGGFTVLPPPDNLRDRVLAGERPAELDYLSLADCQRFAAENSRNYQTRREALYLAALDLSLQDYLFGTQLGFSGSASVTGDDADAETFSADGGPSITKVLGGGATVVLDLGGSLFKNLASGTPGDFISDVSISVTRPLLSGGTNEAIFEPRTRAERRVVDEARAFERFRRSFGVDVVSRYLRILEQQEVVANEENNVNNLGVLRARNDALSSAGRMDDIQAGQATQDELSARSRLINAQSQLESLYDGFKFFMGVPIDVELTLDRHAFDTLATEGVDDVMISEQDAIKRALVERLDLASTRDQYSDAERILRIAEDALGSRLNLVTSAGASSDVEPGINFQPADLNWNFGFNYDLAVDRLGERNAYRAGQLARDAAQRALDQAEDQLRVDIRADLRTLRQAAEDFKIQDNSVVLAERRVESTELKMDAGRAQTRDLLEARNSLVQAQNSRVGSLVDFKLARLNLLLDMEELVLDEEGVRARDPEILAPTGEEN